MIVHASVSVIAAMGSVAIAAEEAARSILERLEGDGEHVVPVKWNGELVIGRVVPGSARLVEFPAHSSVQFRVELDDDVAPGPLLAALEDVRVHDARGAEVTELDRARRMPALDEAAGGDPDAA